MKIALIIDSASGIKNTQDYKDLYLVPLMITKENGEQVADDENLSFDDFYQLFDSELLKTSQSIPGEMMKKWDELLESYDQVICLLISKGLSGQFNTCYMMAQDEPYKGKVFVVDTNGVAILLKKQVSETLEYIKQGKTGEEITRLIEESNQDFTCFIIPKSLKQLVRGGRISKSAASLAKILKITPILKYDGTIDKEGKTRTFKKAIEQSLELLEKKCKDGDKILDIAYSRSEDETITLVKKSIEEKGFEINVTQEMPNTITCHTGRETFALAVWKK